MLPALSYRTKIKVNLIKIALFFFFPKPY